MRFLFFKAVNDKACMDVIRLMWLLSDLLQVKTLLMQIFQYSFHLPARSNLSLLMMEVAKTELSPF